MTSLWSAIIAFMKALIEPASKAVVGYIIWKAAQDEAAAKQLGRENELRKKQLDVAAGTAPDPADVRDSMRDGKL